MSNSTETKEEVKEDIVSRFRSAVEKLFDVSERGSWSIASERKYLSAFEKAKALEEQIKSQLAQLTRENEALRKASKQAIQLIDAYIYGRDCELRAVTVSADLDAALAMGKEK